MKRTLTEALHRPLVFLVALAFSQSATRLGVFPVPPRQFLASGDVMLVNFTVMLEIPPMVDLVLLQPGILVTGPVRLGFAQSGGEVSMTIPSNTVG
jgi:hypothetical protein